MQGPALASYMKCYSSGLNDFSQLHGLSMLVMMVGSDAACFSVCSGVIWKVCVCFVELCVVFEVDVKE